MTEDKCKKCGIPIIINYGCLIDSRMEKKQGKKEINYVVMGSPTLKDDAIIKMKCVKCGTEFEVYVL